MGLETITLGPDPLTWAELEARVRRADISFSSDPLNPDAAPVAVITVPLAAIVVPTVLVVFFVLVFIAWCFWRIAKRRKLAAEQKADDEEKARFAPRPFLTAEPIAPALVVQNTDTGSSGPARQESSSSSDDKSMSRATMVETLEGLGKSASPGPSPLLPSTPLTTGSRRLSESEDDTLRLGGFSDAAQEKARQFRERRAASVSSSTYPTSPTSPTSPTTLVASPTSTLPPASAQLPPGIRPLPQLPGSSGSVPHAPPMILEPEPERPDGMNDEEFNRYSQELSRALQRVGFTPQALLESLNRVQPGTEAAGEDMSMRRPSFDARIERRRAADDDSGSETEARPPAYDG